MGNRVEEVVQVPAVEQEPTGTADETMPDGEVLVNRPVVRDEVEPNLTPNLQEETPNLTPNLIPVLTQDDSEMVPVVISELPVSFQFEGRGTVGRDNTFWETIEILEIVRSRGKWPGGVSAAMHRYYKREYPEYFTNGRSFHAKRAENKEKANRLRSENRPRRRYKKVQRGTGSTPIDIQSRREKHG